MSCPSTFSAGRPFVSDNGLLKKCNPPTQSGQPRKPGKRAASHAVSPLHMIFIHNFPLLWCRNGCIRVSDVKGAGIFRHRIIPGTTWLLRESESSAVRNNIGLINRTKDRAFSLNSQQNNKVFSVLAGSGTPRSRQSALSENIAATRNSALRAPSVSNGTRLARCIRNDCLNDTIEKKRNGFAVGERVYADE